MVWSDVANKIKFFGSEDNGLDGLPATVNGLPPTEAPFQTRQKRATFSLR
jgi:hypothetical protein